jgi:hypothetical protein
MLRDQARPSQAKLVDLTDAFVTGRSMLPPQRARPRDGPATLETARGVSSLVVATNPRIAPTHESIGTRPTSAVGRETAWTRGQAPLHQGAVSLGRGVHIRGHGG